LLDLLGVDAEAVPDGAVTHLTFTHGVTSWWVFVLLGVVAALVAGVVVCYRAERVHASPGRRLSLAALRCVALVTIVLILLGPALAVATHRTVEPYVLVLVDASLSMSIRDRYRLDESAWRAADVLNTDAASVRARTPSRAELARALLEADNGRLLGDLTRRGRVRVFSFDRSVTVRRTVDSTAAANDPAGRPAGPELAPIEPVGQATNLARAVRQALGSVGGSPVAGVVIISDGQNTEGDDPATAAALAGSMDVPIFTVGVGESVEPRNVRIAQVWAPDSVFRGDPFLVEAQIDAEGYAPREWRVELIAQRVGSDGTLGPKSTVADKSVSLAGEDQQRIEFEHRPRKTGDHILTVRTDVLDDEVIETDNRRQVSVKVLSDKARVLLISGAPSWEYRMVSTLFMRDRTIDVSCWLQTLDPEMRQTGNTVIDRLPQTPEQLFAYDLVVFMDPDPEAFDQAWVDALERFLGEHAGGVMWIAGPKHTPDFFRHNRTRDVVRLLPVRIGELSLMDIESLMSTHTQSWPLKVTAAGADHVMIRLDSDPQVNRRMWQNLPGIYWSLPARSAVPGASVLAEHVDPRRRTGDGPRPLLIAGRYGPGRTVFMGFNGTWRWRKLGEGYFDRFWVQAVRYLVEGRLLGAQKRGRIATDRPVYAVGGRVAISARLYDADYQPLAAPTVAAELRAPRRPPRIVRLKAVTRQPGRYEASVVADRIGLNEIAVRLRDGDGGAPVTIARQFRVEAPKVELADPRLNRATLAELAARSGGRYFAMDQAGQIVRHMPRRTQTLVVPGKPVVLWDTGRLLVFLVGLLTVEWALRKRLKMM
ncbi:MAG: hypothetical protein GVY28_07830, partial [Alphaproteobacteria bacterium]|nr:hypothetical protein [Alphaproteobacteria bacterium]